MDLRRKLDLDKLNDSYPGHFTPEVSLFTTDSVNKTIHNDFKEVSNEDCKHLATNPIPRNSLQLIRLRGRPPVPSALNNIDQINLEIESLVSLLDLLHFPLSPIIHACQDLRLQIGTHFHRDNKETEPIFYVCGSRFCGIWVHYLDTSSTRVVMVNFLPPEFEDKLRLHDMLGMLIMPQYLLCFSHPMFFALVMVHMVQVDVMDAYTKDAVSLKEIENNFVTLKSAGRMETLQRLRDLGRLAIGDRYIFITLHKVLEFARRVNENYFGAGSSRQSDPTVKAFLWHVDKLQDLVALDIAYLTSISESVANQQTALTSIINMQDGTSMKTLAVITMAFLPATFVATLFAMPIFQWSDEQGHIISRQFWIYWAVVIPLTLTVFLLWLGWWYWRSIRKEYNDEESPPLQDLQAWLSATLGRKTRSRRKRSSSVEMLQGNNMKRYEKNFYGMENRSKGAGVK